MMDKPMDSSYGLFIGGEWRDDKREKLNAFCPANGELLSTFVEANQEDVDDAVKAAWKAFGTWKKVNPSERSAVMMKWADLIDQNLDTLAMTLCLDGSKPIRESAMEVNRAADLLRYYACAVRTVEDRATMIDDNTLGISLSEPYGVVGLIVPWNFPFLLAMYKMAPAIAAGNTVVIKPSSDTSLSLLELAKVMAQALPPGVINVVTGKGSTAGNYLLDHPDIKKISFTGSTEVGYTVSAAAAKKLIPVSLELGGKSANIFFPDCNWDKAIEGFTMGILFNQGQVCVCGSRALIHKDIYDRFLDACIEQFNKVKIGLPWLPETQMSSVINDYQLNKILNYVDVGQKEGAKLACGGTRITENGFDKGYFIRPAILSDVNNEMRVAREEIFGPVICAIPFENEENAVSIANESEYGLAGGIWTQDINRAIRVARGVETGRMWVNTYMSLPPHIPFGGYKKSGMGHEAHLLSISEYSQIKSIQISLSETKLGFYNP